MDKDNGGTYIDVSLKGGDNVSIAAHELDKLETEVDRYCESNRDKLLRLELDFGGEYFMKVSQINDFGLTTPEAREKHWTQLEAIRKSKKALFPESD